jgi:serine/threonine protein kinase
MLDYWLAGSACLAGLAGSPVRLHSEHTGNSMIQVEKMYEFKEQLEDVNARSDVRRAIRRADGLHVVIKTVRGTGKAANKRARLVCLHEFELLKLLVDVDGVVKPVEFISLVDGGALVLRDSGGVSLACSFDAVRSQRAFLQIALQITTTLGCIHSRHIVHKDVKPQNILLHADSLRIELMDFGLSALRGYNNDFESGADKQKRTEGTLLLYMAPEQSGQVTTTIDHRADFYSLGVTMYHLLAGRLPFEGRTPAELIAQHIERVETALIDLPKTRLPVCRALSDIVAKLMRKDADERYQSATGIAADLRRCLDALFYVQQGPGRPRIVADPSLVAAVAAAVGSSPLLTQAVDFETPVDGDDDDIQLKREFAIVPLGADDHISILPQRTRVLHGRAAEIALLSEFFASASAYNVADTHEASNDDTRRNGLVGEESRLVVIEGEAGMV